MAALWAIDRVKNYMQRLAQQGENARTNDDSLEDTSMDDPVPASKPEDSQNALHEWPVSSQQDTPTGEQTPHTGGSSASRSSISNGDRCADSAEHAVAASGIDTKGTTDDEAKAVDDGANGGVTNGIGCDAAVDKVAATEGAIANGVGGNGVHMDTDSDSVTASGTSDDSKSEEVREEFYWVCCSCKCSCLICELEV